MDSAGRPGFLKRFWQSYFGAGIPSRMDDVRDLWSDSIDAATYEPPGEDRYRATILEQYRIYVEMADRISARRGLTNTFFLSLNTAIFALAGASWQGLVRAPSWLLVPPLVALLAECMSWYWLMRSYRQLNGAKYAVIGALEERLPASPYHRGEWAALGSGESKARYWPFTHVEQRIPIIFSLGYLGGFVAVVST